MKAKVILFSMFCIGMFLLLTNKTNDEVAVNYATDTIYVHDTIYLKAKPISKVSKRKVAKKGTNTKPIAKVSAKRTKSGDYRISEKGKQMIKQHEGLRLEKYVDSDGHSVGYGHYLQKGETFDVITMAQADSLFKADIAQVERSIKKLLVTDIDTKGYVFSQDFIDGFGDMLYNCGHGTIADSEIYHKLKYNVRWDRPEKVDLDLKFIASKVKTFNISVEGHKNRRNIEGTLMASN